MVLLSYLYGGKRTISVKVVALTSSVRVDWVLAAVFNKVEDFEILTVEKTETLKSLGYRIVQA